MKIIGIHGASRTGKDTLANEIIQTCRKLDPEFRIVKRSFAWPLKQVTEKMFGWAGVKGPEHYDRNPEDRYLKVVGDKCAVDLWIEIGTKMREVDPDIWVNLMRLNFKNVDAIVIPDMRHLNEYQMGRDEGGLMIKTTRPDGKVLGMDSNLGHITDWDCLAGPTLNDVLKVGRGIGVNLVSGVYA